MRRRFALAALALAALAVPAAVIAADQGRFAADIHGQEMFWTDGPATTNSNKFRPLFEGQGAGQAAAVEVSTDIASGKARLRIVARDPEFGEKATVHPANVTLGPGARSFTFALVPGNQLPYEYAVQWRRAGDQEVRARSVTARLVGYPD